jgi:hypothetical protein
MRFSTCATHWRLDHEQQEHFPLGLPEMLRKAGRFDSDRGSASARPKQTQAGAVPAPGPSLGRHPPAVRVSIAQRTLCARVTFRRSSLCRTGSSSYSAAAHSTPSRDCRRSRTQLCQLHDSLSRQDRSKRQQYFCRAVALSSAGLTNSSHCQQRKQHKQHKQCE